jgi:uncharacterized membrane protein
MQWLRRSFVAGFFVTVPLFISVAALVWMFRIVDNATTPFYDRLIGRRIPGLGTLSTAAAILAAGVFATNVIGRRVLQRAEGYLLRVPVFRTIYAPVRQLVVAFSPDNDAGFKRVVLVDHPQRGAALGFLTREFAVTRAAAGEPARVVAMVAVYVPTNHLYLGDIFICERDAVNFPDISVEEGIRIFLTGGMALPSKVRV